MHIRGVCGFAQVDMRLATAVLCLAGALWPGRVQAQNITTDGSLGPAQTLTGPNYTIGSALGQQAGANLYQSFGTFAPTAGESATFTGSGVTNILARVTGGSSTMGGTVQSSIPSANLFLINASGITATNTISNLSGDLHVSTANYVRMSDNARFQAALSPPSTLTASRPDALGFTTAAPAALTVNNSTLTVASGKVLDLSGGPITIDGATLTVSGLQGSSALSGRLLVRGIGSVGEIPLDTISTAVTTYAPVQITNSLLLGNNRLNSQSAAMTVLGSTISLSGTEVDTDGYGFGLSFGASFEANNQITITNSNLHSNALGAGRAGGIGLVTASSGSITIDNSNVTSTNGPGGGPAGQINISTGTLLLTNNARIGSTTMAGSQAGTVSIAVHALTVANGAEVFVTPTSTGLWVLRISASETITLDNGIIRNAEVVGPITSKGGTLESIRDFLPVAGTSLTTISGTTVMQGASTYVRGTTVNGGTLQLAPGASLAATGALTVNGGTFDLGNNVQTVGALAGTGGTIALGSGTLTTASTTNTSLASAITGSGSLVKQGGGTLTLTGASNYSGGTTIAGGLINFAAANNLGTGTITLNGGGLQWAAGTNQIDISGRLAPLGTNGGTFDTNGNNVTFATALSGPGGLTKSGLGTLTLSGSNTYQGGTTVNAGTLQLAPGASLLAGSALTLTGGTFAINGNASLGALSGTGGVINLISGTLTADSSSNTTLAAAITGGGAFTKAGSGTLSLTGANTYTGPTTVNGGTLAVNGSITSNVNVNVGGTLGGSGVINGNVTTLGTLAPGNSIGTLTVNGNYVQSAGSTYAVEVNAAGQSDKLIVAGTATIAGGTVAVQAQSGSYARNTTYTILTANGGLSGAYSSVTSNFAFLTPSLSYDANNVYLSLLMNQSAFAAGARTANQYAVGTVIDQNWTSASGDFATVLNALSVLNTQQGPYALNQLSGQPYADFGTANLASNTLFMNALGQQMALARGGAGVGQRQALAQACELEACDATSPFSVWASGLGGFGSVQGDGNSQTFTYNLGGAAAGIDYRVTPSLLLGIGAGYTSGTQWTDTFSGKGWTNAVSVAAYGSFTMAGFYADLLAGYAWSNNQLQRQITIPGLQPRTANGSTGANQFLGQAEIGYQVPVYAPAAASITPFARLQVIGVNQAAFNEWGANSLSLNVQQQTTNSLRSTLGAQLNGAIGLGDTRTLDMALRLGWLHEYAYTGRPVTAAFAGAPAAAFTVYGATPQRDAAAIGFQASTNVAAATQIYFRYDGDIGSGTDNHALNLGLRISW
jgi:outer membrane autotransporter protein